MVAKIDKQVELENTWQGKNYTEIENIKQVVNVSLKKQQETYLVLLIFKIKISNNSRSI